jgi:hypothetical protein
MTGLFPIRASQIFISKSVLAIFDRSCRGRLYPRKVVQLRRTWEKVDPSSSPSATAIAVIKLRIFPPKPSRN